MDASCSLAEVDADGAVRRGRRIAGGPSEAIFQPEWSPGGVLHFVSDSTGWWNLYQWKAGAARPLCPMPAEFGRAMWSFGFSTYGFATENRILCCYTQQGADHLAWLDAESRQVWYPDPVAIHQDRLAPLLFRAARRSSAHLQLRLPRSYCMDAHSGVLTPVRSSIQYRLDGRRLPVATRGS